MTPIGPLHRGPGEINYPIAAGGVVVHPGDVIVADMNGVVVVPRDSAEEILDRLRDRKAKESDYTAGRRARRLLQRLGRRDTAKRRGLGQRRAARRRLTRPPAGLALRVTVRSLNGSAPPAVLLGGEVTAVAAARSLGRAGVRVHALGAGPEPVRSSRFCAEFVKFGGDIQAAGSSGSPQRPAGPSCSPARTPGWSSSRDTGPSSSGTT